MSNRLRLVLVTILLVVAGVGAFAAPALSPGDDGPTGAAPPSADAGANATAQDNDTAATTSSATVDELVEPCAAEPPTDFADPADNDSVIGWVDGVWYDEPLNIDTSGGVTQSELERLSARATARVEALRCLDAADGAPAVTVQSRAEFRDDRGDRSASDQRRTFENARLETMLLVSQQEDAVDEQGETEGAAIQAFYSPLLEEITLVTNDTEQIQYDEATLAHELGHAVQDQQFDFSVFDGQTTDAERGDLALLEGDVTLIEQKYRRGCAEAAWVESCLGYGGNQPADDDEEVDPEAGEVPAGPPNWGLYFIEFQPYSDGPAFVEALYEQGGWEAVNERYDDPPDSALPVARPGVANASLSNVSVPDRSDATWERIDRRGQPDYDTIGVAGISAMFLTPSFETEFEQNIYPPQSTLNTGPDGTVDESNPVNYWHPETEGWRDDKLYVYTDDAGGRASVWRLEWTSARAAVPFVRSYTDLIEYRGGQQVEGEDRTYTFSPDSEFDMAVSIRFDGDTVTVVTAPTVEDLSAVHGP